MANKKDSNKNNAKALEPKTKKTNVKANAKTAMPVDNSKKTTVKAKLVQKFEERVITQDDLDMNPTLVEEGVQVGDTVKLPMTEPVIVTGENIKDVIKATKNRNIKVGDTAYMPVMVPAASLNELIHITVFANDTTYETDAESFESIPSALLSLDMGWIKTKVEINVTYKGRTFNTPLFLARAKAAFRHPIHAAALAKRITISLADAR